MIDPASLVLARIQFAANISFHILFPSISIALGWMLLYFKLRHGAAARRAGEAADRFDSPWIAAYRFWVKVFALSFALGVVSGVTMSFQFGTNWPGYMNTVGNIAGPLLGYEVLTAFFLEATFLSVMLFGTRRVSPRMHTLATVLVAGGTTLSAFWILALNSWMQTPAGFEMRNGVAHVTSWAQVIFNPSMPYRVTHMLLASGLTVAFLLAGISAYRWLHGDRGAEMRVGLRTGLYTAAILAPLQIVAGDLHGLNTLHHQPAKIAAMEGIWTTQARAPAVLFAIPDERTRSNRFEVAIPGLASIYLEHDRNAVVRGIDAFGDDHPPVRPLFFAFRGMVGIGLLMLATAWYGSWRLRRAGPDTALLPRWLMRGVCAMTFAGWVALLCGWYVTEIGRQPWLVTGVLRTSQAASNLARPLIASTLAMYLLLYAVLIVAYVGVLLYMARKAIAHELPADPGGGVRS